MKNSRFCIIIYNYNIYIYNMQGNLSKNCSFLQKK